MQHVLHKFGHYLVGLVSSDPFGADLPSAVQQPSVATTPNAPGLPPVDVTYWPRDAVQVWGSDIYPE